MVCSDTDGPHAERLAIDNAKNDAKATGNPVQPIAIYVTNPFCGEDKMNCFDYIASEGATIVEPDPPKRKSRGGKWEPPAPVWS
jgi:hypothetical protein